MDSRIVIVLTMILVFMTAPASAAEIKGHPAITAYPGSVATRRDDDGHRAYTIVTGVNPEGKTDETAFDTVRPAGTVIRLAYENPAQRSIHEIYANYLEGLEKGGFKLLFACRADDCGPAYAMSRWNRVSGLRYTGSGMGYIAAKGRKGDQDIYIVVVVAKNRHQIEVVEVAAMETGLVTAQAIAQGLQAEGRVVLDGIFFDTDKAVLKANSEPALAAIAGYLNGNPDLKVFITGHTDATGSFEHNMSLSLSRAKAVVQALTGGHGIEPSRLSSHGVGPLSPRRTNGKEAGRAENRRVEMVERLQ